MNANSFLLGAMAVAALGCASQESTRQSDPAFRSAAWYESPADPSAPGGEPSPTASAISAATPAPFAFNGDICVTNAAGGVVQLTSSGEDRAPKMSPGGRHIAFIRKSKNEAYLPAGGEEDSPKIFADQVWMLDTRTRAEKMLVEDRMPGENDTTKAIERTVAQIDDDSLCFSPDGSSLYFITSAWAVSGALHVVNIRSGQERFICAASSVEVVQTGEHAGHLIVEQHRYFQGCGSYDWYWLIDSKGREIGPVGETYEQVETFKEMCDRR